MAKKKFSKTTIIAIIVTAALAIAFAIFLPFYLKSLEPYQELYKSSQIKIVAFGEEIGVFNLEQILQIDGVKQKDFVAIYDTSISDRKEKEYTGVELKALLEGLEINLHEAKQINFTASDRMVKVYKKQDVLKDDNVFIAYKVNDKPFNTGIHPQAHKEEQEDGGPFVVIKVDDTYSQNRCKLLVEIEIS